MLFRESLRISYGQMFYGTGYYIDHLFAEEETLSQPLRSWDISQSPDKDVLDLLNSAGTDIAPRDIQRKTGKVVLDKERLLLAEIRGSAVIRALTMTLPMDEAIDLE